MQPVYLTEDGNYAIADTSEDQENQELRISQKSDEAVLGVQDLDPNTLRQVRLFLNDFLIYNNKSEDIFFVSCTRDV